MNSTKLFALMSSIMILSVSIIPAMSTVVAEEAEDDLVKLLAELEGSAPEKGETKKDIKEGAVKKEKGEHDAANEILDEWTFSAKEFISVTPKTKEAIIKTTEVLFSGKPVSQYKIYYSDKELVNIEDNDIKESIVSVDKTVNKMVFLTLNGLDSDKKYYLTVSPIHPTDSTVEPLAMISEEVSFMTKKEAIGSSTNIFTNVSYTYKDGKVTLTWKPSTKASKAEIQVRLKSEGEYTKVGTPNLNAGTFTFSVDKPGSYFLKMNALDTSGKRVGVEKIQMVKVDKITVPTKNSAEKTVKATPKVGPASDMLIGIFLFSILIYLVYRFRSIKIEK